MPKPTDQYDMPAQAARATREQQARMDARAGQMRQDASMKSFNDALARNAAPLPMNTKSITTYSTDSYSAGSYSAGGAGFSGAMIAIIIGIALIILCVYAIAHCASLLAIGKIAVIGIAAIAACAAVLAVLAFIRNHPISTMIVVGAAIYGYVHFFG